MHAHSPDLTAGYLDALRALAPLIAEHRGAFDSARRLPPEVFDALADAGFFRLWLPVAVGGPELSPVEFMSIVEAASALDGSVGWIVANGAGMSRAGGYLPESVVRDWFADPRAFVVSATGAVGTAVRTDGGYRVSGRWPFGSGAHHGSRFMGLAMEKDADGRDGAILCCYMPRSDITIDDRWHVSGLRGTGSCDFDAHDVFVPAAHTHPFVDFEPTQPGTLYALPNVTTFAWSISGVPLGIARRAIGEFIDTAKRKPRQGTNMMLCDRETVQATVGRVEALHRAARASMIDRMTALIAVVEARDVDNLPPARAALRAACALAAESAARIVDMLAMDLGAASIFEAYPMERCVRDVNAATKHIAMSPNNYVVAGRISLGLDPGTTRF